MAGLKKKVDLVCGRSFKIGPTLFSGSFSNIILDTEAIRIALNNKASVKEVLKNGKRAPLDFANYAIRNPMGFDVENQEVENNNKPNNYHVRTIRVGKSQIDAHQPPVTIQYGVAPVETKPTVINNKPEKPVIKDDPHPVVNTIKGDEETINEED